MTQPTTQGQNDDLPEILRDIRQRLTKIEQTIEPPTRPDGHPFRKPGQHISESEYERRTGVPRVAVALALSLLRYNQAETARRIGVNRRTLQVSQEFEPYRQARISIWQTSGLARQNSDDDDDETED